MNEPKHTKGPWAIEPERDEEGVSMAHLHEFHSRRYITAEDGDVCICTMRDHFTDGNARLISAAPDLLAALKDIVCFADAGGGSDEHMTSGSWAMRLNRARAALAKAQPNSNASSDSPAPRGQEQGR